jgi:hypothetical protein
VDVYPSRRKIWASILVSAALLLIGLIAAGAVIARGPRPGAWFVPVALVLFGWACFSSVGELRRPIPIAHFDEAGFECALGRVPWDNVSAASIRWHWRGRYPSRRLFFDLRNPAEELGPETREYLYRSPFGGPVAADGQIDLPLWDSTQRVLADVRRFHPTLG